MSLPAGVGRARQLVALGRATRHAIALAVLTGATTGLAVALFDRVVAEEAFRRVLEAPLWVQALAPVLGLTLSWAALHAGRRTWSPSTADEYIRAFHDPEGSMPLRGVPSRLAASAATLGTGAALGFEGPSIYAGAAIGTWIQTRWSRRFGRLDPKVLLVCGAAAGVAAIFKAPATGLVFALEVPYRQDLARRMLLPAMFSAAVGYLVFVAINGTEPLFPVGDAPPVDLRELGGAALLGLLAGVGARGIAGAFRIAKDAAARWPLGIRLPLVAAGLVGTFAGVRATTGESLTIGSGYRAVEWALEPGHALLAVVAVFALRAGATGLVLAGGGVGGLFVPLVVQGALLGAAVSQAVGSEEPTLFPLLGIAAFLGAGYRVPLAAVVFVAEATGRPGFVVPGLIAAATSQLLMGRSSVSPYQEGSRVGLLERRLAAPVAQALRADASTVPPDATLAELFDHHVSQLHLTEVPVVDGSRYVGVAGLDDLLEVPRDRWSTTAVAEITRTDVPVVALDSSLGAAARDMEAADLDRLPVVDGTGRFVGLVTMGEILKLDAIVERTGSLG